MPLGLSLPRDTVSDPSTHPETQVLDNNDKTKKDVFCLEGVHSVKPLLKPDNRKERQETEPLGNLDAFPPKSPRTDEQTVLSPQQAPLLAR